MKKERIFLTSGALSLIIASAVFLVSTIMTRAAYFGVSGRSLDIAASLTMILFFLGLGIMALSLVLCFAAGFSDHFRSLRVPAVVSLVILATGILCCRFAFGPFIIAASVCVTALILSMFFSKMARITYFLTGSCINDTFLVVMAALTASFGMLECVMGILQTSEFLSAANIMSDIKWGCFLAFGISAFVICVKCGKKLRRYAG